MAKGKVIFRKGKQLGMVMKVEEKDGKEIFTKATEEDIGEMSAAEKIKMGTRVKAQKKKK
jgi:hypothetical protein